MSSFPRQHRDSVHRRRDRFEGKSRPEAKPRRLEVRYSANKGQFGNSVAHALKKFVKYRSDGGKVARGLVFDSDPSGSFHKVHWGLVHGKRKFTEGEQIWLWALLHRRTAATPSDRWVTKVQFDRYWTTKQFGPEVVPAPQLTLEERAEQLLDKANDIAADFPGDQGKRIRAHLALAKKQGYPRMLELWYYNPEAIRAFNREYLVGSEQDQERMIQNGGGFPLKGKLRGNWQGSAPSWREYPFRSLMQQLLERPLEPWRLKAIDQGIGESLQMLRESPGGKGAGGEGSVSGPTLRFRKHLRELAKTPGNLYYESDRNTTDRRGIWEMLP